MISDYERIERAIRFIKQHVTQQPGLEEVASHVGLSAFHFQRLFRRWAGVSPKRFLAYLTVHHAKQALAQSESILDTSYALGLSSPARLHDHFVSLEAITPGEYKKQGRGLKIVYGVHPSPFGNMLLALTHRGVCALSFVNQYNLATELHVLQQTWPHAELEEDGAQTALMAASMFHARQEFRHKLHLAVQGTNFQINVWKALLKIPNGRVLSYRQLAASLGQPMAARAVASAVAANPIGYLIPCHRVIRSSGEIGEYHWGEHRKKIMLGWEIARLNKRKPQV